MIKDNGIKLKVSQIYQSRSGHSLKGDFICGTSRSIQCSCMSLVLVNWTFLRSPALWDAFNLDCILSKGDQLFNFIGRFKISWDWRFTATVLGRKLISVKVEFLENETGEITAGDNTCTIYRGNCK